MHNQSICRREFAQTLAMGAATLSLATLPALSEEPASAPPASKNQNERPHIPPAEAATRDEWDLMLQVLRERYPDKRLDGTTLDAIRAELIDNSRHSRQLSSFPLSNADAPSFHFSAYRAATRTATPRHP